MYLRPEHKKKLEKVMKRLDSSFFFYDLDHLKAHLTYMDEVKDSDMKLWYACKANPLSAILKIFRNLNFGVDVASLGELDQVLSSGVEPEDILSTGPAKGKAYLKSLIDNEINVIVLESLNQAYWLDEIAKESNVKPKVLLRVQLAWDEGKSVLGGNAITPFGLDESEWLKLDRSKVTHLDIQGCHVFQWGNLLELDKLEKIWDRTASDMVAFASKMEIPLNIIDLGGGLGIAYENDTRSLDFKDVTKILQRIKEKYQLKTIWMELGRYAVGGSGHYMTKVVDKKIVRGQNILVLDGGINHIARPALVHQGFPCELFRDSSAPKKSFQIHGPLCTAIDMLGTFELPEDICEGDWLVFSQCGAYGFTEAMPFFLCHDLPAEVVYYNGDMMTPRTIKTSSDWLV
ncbi:pyridoxal-dependent decarboxylase, pyridoxal-binding domain protein [Bacteriovorax sp. BSW11_IV]|uniref:PLP-dependent decarboxylase n=1 Tax=Bacteriovorax sp. BSW11_IV TaxID=1353529 RepID=UPI00038A063D|nr:PLP-dependent decarboxylase [Bacteriovorax sp. BSW11_IV]EQC43620.1 pyridoxal-dependent decarboxylase, pyridoxal-binding domain protein [Bacteriovorax sp. BSW11_IV]